MQPKSSARVLRRPDPAPAAFTHSFYQTIPLFARARCRISFRNAPSEKAAFRAKMTPQISRHKARNRRFFRFLQAGGAACTIFLQAGLCFCRLVPFRGAAFSANRKSGPRHFFSRPGCVFTGLSYFAARPLKKGCLQNRKETSGRADPPACRNLKNGVFAPYGAKFRAASSP
jgi:hypothetical protein